MRQSFFIWGALVAALCIPISPATATPISWNIEVTVNTAPGGLGFGPAFTFGTLPESFSGTFTADDTLSGPISNLSLTVGGVDIPSAFPIPFTNSFNPTANELTHIVSDTAANPRSVMQLAFFTTSAQDPPADAGGVLGRD